MIVALAILLHYGDSSSYYTGITRNFQGALNNFYMYVFTSSSDPINYHIEDATGTIASRTVSRGQTVIHNLPTSYSVIDSSFAHRNKGLHVYTENDDELISVLVVNNRQFTVGEYNVLPYMEYDVSQYQYYIVSTGATTGTFSLIFLIGNSDNTSISITPTQDIILPEDTQDSNSANIAITAGTTHTFTLHRLQTITILALQDLTGTSITSDKPLTVIGGHECGTVPRNTDFCEHMTTQIPPTVAWGKQYLLSPYQGRTSGQYYRIIAAEDETVVTNSCSESRTLLFNKAGNWREIYTSRSTYCHLAADKPIAVFQLGIAHEVDNIGDPVISYLPPIEQHTTETTIYTLNFVTMNYINIVSSQQTSVFLDDTLQTVTWNEIRDADNEIIGYGTHVVTEAGDHRVAALDSFYLIVYGWASDNTAFSYAVGRQNQQSESKFCIHDTCIIFS